MFGEGKTRHGRTCYRILWESRGGGQDTKLSIRVNVRLFASDNVVDNFLHKCTLCCAAEGDGATVPCCMLPGYRLGQRQTVFWHTGARLSLARSTCADRESEPLASLTGSVNRGWRSRRGGCFHNPLTDTADSCLRWRRADAEKPGLHKLACV